MWLAGKVVTVGGIGEVSTHPDHRHKGLAKQVLDRAVEYMQSSGIVISALHAGNKAIRDIYVRLGWNKVTVPGLCYPLRQVFPALPDTLGLAGTQVTRVLDLESDANAELRRALSLLYAEKARVLNGAFVREHPE